MSVIPQTTYSGDVSPPLMRVYWDGTGTLLTGSVLAFDVTASNTKTVTRPATANLEFVAGIYTGSQGASLSDAQWIDIVPADARGARVSVLGADDVYAVGDALVAVNGSYNCDIADDTGDVSGEPGRVIPGFFGFATAAVTVSSNDNDVDAFLAL